MLSDRARGVCAAGRGVRLASAGHLAGLVALLALMGMGVTSGARGQDVTAPQLASYSVAPPIVDVTAGPASLTATAQITDDLSGFESAAVLYVSPDFGSLLLLSIDASHRVSGDALDGIYVASMQVPEFSKSGTWTVYSFSMQDVAGNSVSIPPASLPAEATFDVVSIEDGGPPSVVSLTASPGAVDVTTGPGAVTVTLRVTDDVSGTDHSTVTLESPSGAETAAVTLTAADRISGDALDGVYQGVIDVPQLAENGTWTVKNVKMVDVFGYVADVPGASLPPPGSPAVDVSSAPDSGSPQLVELTVVPTVVDISGGPRDVVVTVHITDDVTGVVSAGGLLQSPEESVALALIFDAAHRISGDSLDGFYRNTVQVQPSGPLGFWEIQIFAADAAGNNFLLSGGALPGPWAISVVNSLPPPAPLLGPAALGLLAGSLAGVGAWAGRRRARR